MNFFAARFRLALLLALLAAALAGCMSMVGLGYGHAETVAGWKADQYFDLEGDQKDLFRSRFGRLYAWHRYEQLPEYVAFLRAGTHRLQDGLDPGDVEWFAEGLRARYRLIVRQAAGDAADLFASLTPRQIENLQRQWAKDNRKFASEHRVHGTEEERRRARAKRIVSQIRNWTGSLTAEQEARIVALTDAMPDTERLRYEDRVRRQREFVHLLRERNGDREKFAARLTEWLSNWEAGRDPHYARLAEEGWKQRVQLLVAVERMLTPEQRNNVLQRLQGHISEFHRLSRRS
jgi:hypothetical protein